MTRRHSLPCGKRVMRPDPGPSVRRVVAGWLHSMPKNVWQGRVSSQLGLQEPQFHHGLGAGLPPSLGRRRRGGSPVLDSSDSVAVSLVGSLVRRMLASRGRNSSIADATLRWRSHFLCSDGLVIRPHPMVCTHINRVLADGSGCAAGADHGQGTVTGRSDHGGADAPGQPLACPGWTSGEAGHSKLQIVALTP